MIWNKYPENKPDKYGKYRVKLTNGKEDLLIWNNTGFSAKNDRVMHWQGGKK